MKADGSGSDVPGTGCYNLEIGGNAPEAEHKLESKHTAAAVITLDLWV